MFDKVWYDRKLLVKKIAVRENAFNFFKWYH